MAGALKSFTVSYDVGDVSEGTAARATAERLELDHREVTLSAADVASTVPALVAALDQPNGDPALVALRARCRPRSERCDSRGRRRGRRSSFGGYPRYRWLHRAETIGRRAPEPAARAAAMLVRRSPGSQRLARLADVMEPEGSVRETSTGSRLADAPVASSFTARG